MTPMDYELLRKKLIHERERVKQLVGRGSPSAEGADTSARAAIQDNLQVILAEVDHALREMDAGTYGCCGGCGERIPFERLEARPQATLCVKCRSRGQTSQPVRR